MIGKRRMFYPNWYIFLQEGPLQDLNLCPENSTELHPNVIFPLQISTFQKRLKQAADIFKGFDAGGMPG